MPKAAGLADEIRAKLGLESELIEGSGGVFDIHANGQLVFSKQEQGNRFPEHDEVIEGINKVTADS